MINLQPLSVPQLTIVFLHTQQRTTQRAPNLAMPGNNADYGLWRLNALTLMAING
jgi:hypothetical protein